MNLLIVLAATALASCASPVAADVVPPDQRAGALITGCVASHYAEGSDARGCVGDVTRACSRELGGAAETTGGSVECAAREQRAWATLLEQSIETLRARESGAQREALERAVQQGEAWAQARCAYHASFYEGGSLARVLHAQCMRDTTAERAIDMRTRLNDYDQ